MKYAISVSTTGVKEQIDAASYTIPGEILLEAIALSIAKLKPLFI